MADNGNSVLDGLYLLAKSFPNKKAQAKAYILAIIGNITAAASAAHTHVVADITDYVAGNLTDGDYGDITVSGTGATLTIDSAVVTEAKQVLADNTTNDVSTTKHGYAPKAPNDTTKFLRGDATWAAPASASGISITNFGTYALLLADTTISAGNGATVTGFQALFIKASATLADWFAIAKSYIWQPGANTKWYMRMDNNATDSSGNGYNGTATDVTYVTGKVGSHAGSFNGSTSQIAYAGSVLVAAITDVTIMCWVNLTGTSLHGTFVSCSNTTAGCGYSFGVGSTTVENNGNNLIIIWDNIRWINTGKALGTGWVHVCMQLNSLSKPIGYINGVQVYTDESTNPSAPNASGTAQTVIGNYFANRQFTGTIDDVIIENRFWTAREILDYYTLTR